MRKITVLIYAFTNFAILVVSTQAMEMQKSSSFPQDLQKVNISFINKVKRSNSEPIIIVTKRSVLERHAPVRKCSASITPEEVKKFNEARGIQIAQSHMMEESK